MRRSKDDAEQTRQGILLAAEDLFSRQGVATTSLDQIARKAGVTRGAIYWHFKDKSAVLQALRAKFRPPNDELTFDAFACAEDDILAVFERSADTFLQLFAADQSRQRIFKILSTLPLDPDDPAASEAWVILLRFVNQAQSLGVMSDDLSPEESALTLLALINGLLSEWIATGGVFDLPQIGMRIIRRQLKMMRAGGHDLPPRDLP